MKISLFGKVLYNMDLDKFNYFPHLYDIVRYEDDNAITVKFYLPGFKVNEIKCFERNGNLVVKTNAEVEDNLGYWGSKIKQSSEQEIDLNSVYVFSYAKFVNGVLEILLKKKESDEVKEYEIDVPQPDSKSYPQLLNEDSDI